METNVTDAKKRVLTTLKLSGPATAGELAAALGMTDVAVRQHLALLQRQDLVRQTARPAQNRGRPAMEWSLTDTASALFPDRHGELTVSLIESMKSVFGAKGMKSIIDARTESQLAQYRKALDSCGPSLRERTEKLAELRTAEGYMAEVREGENHQLSLTEHHCPICEAAKTCSGLCDAEFDVFKELLGKDVNIKRTEHLMSGADRCVYEISATQQQVD